MGFEGGLAGLGTRCFYTVGRKRSAETAGGRVYLPDNQLTDRPKSQGFVSFLIQFIKFMNKETNKLYFHLLEFYQCLNINI